MANQIVIIGGGAAGYISALAAAALGAGVVIAERKDRVLKKVLATGNGRCNFTNVHISTQNYYGADPNFVGPSLERFPFLSVAHYFERLGILYSEEESGKVYPLSGQASSVVDALRLEAERLGVNVKLNFNVEKVQKREKRFFVYSSEGEVLKGNKVIIAAGGMSSPELGSNGSGFKIGESLGHRIAPLKPALVQLKTEKEKIKGLQGIKVTANVKAYHGKKCCGEKAGELLFTEYGISGTVIFDLSYLTVFYNDLVFKLDLLPSYDYKKLEMLLFQRRKQLAHLTMENFLNGMVNKKLGQMICKLSGVEKLYLSVADLQDSMIHKMVRLLKEYDIRIVGTTGFKNAQVTAGGILTKDVDPVTMESKIVRGLYFAGEMLDIFGDCGGYNLHWAWASGYAAGINAAKG